MAMSSPPRRRRKSSFFGIYKYNAYKTLNDVDEIMNEAKSSNLCSSDVIARTELNKEEIIQNQIAEMRQEISEWKKICQVVKSRYVDAKQCKNDVILDWVRCKDCFTEEDVAFLNTKVNYEDLVSKMNCLAERIEIVKCKLCKTDANVEADIKNAYGNVQKIKEKLCYLLLDCEESSSFSILDDSGNYSMDSIKLQAPLL